MRAVTVNVSDIAAVKFSNERDRVVAADAMGEIFVRNDARVSDRHDYIRRAARNTPRFTRAHHRVMPLFIQARIIRNIDGKDDPVWMRVLKETRRKQLRAATVFEDTELLRRDATREDELIGRCVMTKRLLGNHRQRATTRRTRERLLRPHDEFAAEFKFTSDSGVRRTQARAC